MLPKVLSEGLQAALNRKEPWIVWLNSVDPVWSMLQICDQVMSIGLPNVKIYRVDETGIADFDKRRSMFCPATAMDAPQVQRRLLASGSQPEIYLIRDAARLMQAQLAVPGWRMLIQDLQASSGVGRVYVFIEQPGCHPPEIAEPYVVVAQEGFPDDDEIQGIVKRSLADRGEAFASSREDIVDALKGLSFHKAVSGLQTKLAGVSSSKELAQALWVFKWDNVLSSMPGIVPLPKKNPLVLRGFEYLEEYLAQRMDQMCIFGNKRLKGIILVGPPGTGKSAFASSLAHRLNAIGVGFELSKTLNSYLGESEKNLASALLMFEKIGKTVLLMEEIDKSINSSSAESDGGTTKRLLGSLHSWLADCQSPIFVVGSCNKLDFSTNNGTSSLTRAGRFDRIFWVDTPYITARREIIEDLFVDFGILKDAGISGTLAEMTRWFSGADLHQLLNDGVCQARFEKVEMVGSQWGKLLAKQADMRRPQVELIKRQFDTLRVQVGAACMPAGRSPADE